MMFKVSRFVADENLMYLIQSVTQESTEDIIGFFHNTALKIAEDSIRDLSSRNKEIKTLNKVYRWNYKNTIVPFKMDVYTRYGENFAKLIIDLYVTIKFPETKKYIDITNMMSISVENSLGLEGASNLPKFNKPKTRKPRGFSS